MTETNLRPNAHTTLFRVDGMTCDHCRHAVATEVYKIDGVLQAYVDVAKGTVQIASEQELDVADVDAAVTEAGYTLLHDAPAEKES